MICLTIQELKLQESRKLTISSVCFVEEILFKLFLFLCCRIGVIIILRQDYKELTYVFLMLNSILSSKWLHDLWSML